MAEQRHGRVHLCGSVPLEDAEAVFRAVGDALSAYVVRIPDGETGERASWIGWQVSRFLHHPELEVIADPAGPRHTPKFRPRPGANAAGIGFGPIGYADAARTSWRVFRRLREEGTIPADCRFQVSLPTPLAVIASYVAEGQTELEPIYEAALLGELDEIMATVPHDSLAVQWDTAVEFAMLGGVHPPWFDDREEEIAQRLLRIGAFVPEDVPLGYHLCYASSGHEEAAEPGDAGTFVSVANRLSDELAHSLDWVHLPVPRTRVTGDYLRPLTGLRRRPETQLYLGLVHAEDGIEGARERIDAAAKVLSDFGVATECGLGRRLPEQVKELLRLHVEVADALPGGRAEARPRHRTPARPR